MYLRKAVMEGYKDLSSLEREEIWANFCRRAQTKSLVQGQSVERVIAVHQPSETMTEKIIDNRLTEYVGEAAILL